MTNKIDIMGRLTNNPEIESYTDSNGKMRYSMKWILAQYQGMHDSIFWFCSMYGDMDYLKKQMAWLHKGRRTLVSGTVIKKEKTVIGMNGTEIKVPSFYINVKDVTYADGKVEEDQNLHAGSVDSAVYRAYADRKMEEEPVISGSSPFDEEETDNPVEEIESNDEEILRAQHEDSWSDDRRNEDGGKVDSGKEDSRSEDSGKEECQNEDSENLRDATGVSESEVDSFAEETGTGAVPRRAVFENSQFKEDEGGYA